MSEQLFDTSPTVTFDSKDWSVRETTPRTAKRMIGDYHYLGETGFIHSDVFGLFTSGDCVGVAVFGPLSVPHSAQSAFGLERGNHEGLFELHRLVLNPCFNGRNAGSFLVGRSLRILRRRGARAVISYADASLHVGAVYQACNFTYHGITDRKSDFVTNDGRKIERGPIKGLDGAWVPRSQKHRYVYKFDKSLNVAWPELPYPKLEAVARGDAS